jgi:hypothetical protein
MIHGYRDKLVVALFCLISFIGVNAQSKTDRSINGFTQWCTGHDEATQQLFPVNGNDALTLKRGKTIAHAKFNVKGYGEMSFPIDPRTAEGEEARSVDLSRSQFICITYKASHELILQLRQTGVHGGSHNRISLPASKNFATRKIYLSEFKGGKTPLDLSDVAKFNFAFLSKPDKSIYTAELVVRSFVIDQYQPPLK